VSAFIVRHYGGNWESSASLERPLHTITTKDHHGLVCAFLMKYYGTSTAQSLREPMSTVTADGVKHALVTVNGERYRIADIGMRMLTPRELFRAQGFPDEYIIDPEVTHGDGVVRRLGKTAQIRMCGNSVSPMVACALVYANLSQRHAVAA
jgi:DNA (cytosine-5)-methyltransferase 1